MTFMSRYIDYKERELAEFHRTHKKVKNKDGSYRYIKKVYADDNINF